MCDRARFISNKMPDATPHWLELVQFWSHIKVGQLHRSSISEEKCLQIQRRQGHFTKKKKNRHTLTHLNVLIIQYHVRQCSFDMSRDSSILCVPKYFRPEPSIILSHPYCQSQDVLVQAREYSTHSLRTIQKWIKLTMVHIHLKLEILLYFVRRRYVGYSHVTLL